MRNLSRTLRVAGVALVLGLAGCGKTLGPPADKADRDEVHALVTQAEEAYAQGDLRLAKALLNTVSKKVSGEQNREAFRAACGLKFARAVELIGWVFVTWVAVGFFGQALFCARFVVQWLASEKHGRSVVPVAFWYLSLSGSLVVLSYALWRLDPVFILAYSLNLFIYIRNLMLIRRASQAAAPSQ
jgi:lipid-A-disaccharide synthase-like uncharacterized protein